MTDAPVQNLGGWGHLKQEKEKSHGFKHGHQGALNNGKHCMKEMIPATLCPNLSASHAHPVTKHPVWKAMFASLQREPCMNNNL